MQRSLPFLYLLLVGVVAAGVMTRSALADEPDDEPTKEVAENIRFYNEKVKPLLKQHCYKCHGGGEKLEGELNVTYHEGLVEGGESGPAIDLDDPESSLILIAVRYDELEMPPEGELPESKIAIIEKWVSGGAHGPKDEEPAERSTAHAPPKVNDENRKHWSFQPVKRPAVPSVKNQAWPRDPLDNFILAGLEAKGFSPATRAEKEALLRRAYYDLTGLPPSPAQVRAFLADNSDKAYEKVIDELLASPHYGERWARHWLDLVRYAETNSFERDGAKPFVWRYRDYVIRSLNEDKPYTRFILEQLAGDELDDVNSDSIIATGYYRLGAWDDEPSNPKLALYDDIDDLVGTTNQVFLGLTTNCARCHDHKLDPIPQSDYYRMVAFFRNVQRYGVRSHDTVKRASVRPIIPGEKGLEMQRLVAEHQRKLNEANRTIQTTDKQVGERLTKGEKDDFKFQANRLDILRRNVGDVISKARFETYEAAVKAKKELDANRPPALEEALVVTEHGRDVPATHVLIRGNPDAEGEVVTPGFPQILSPPEPNIVPPKNNPQSSGRRRALAQWIASNDNPLTARVMANRIWQHHFGRGIVRSTNNFGMQGDRPTHPELLDYLASELMQNGWRLKPLHRKIMLSATYQMSSQASEKELAADPENDSFWRFDMRRLAAEELRDSILAVNGTLNRDKMFGPSIYPVIPQEVLAGQSRPGSGWGKSSPEDAARRSIYIHAKRSLIVPIIASFDGADTDFTCPVRFTTTQPTQALGLLNSEFINQQADIFANDLREKETKPSDQIRLALRRVWQREPTDGEVKRGLDLLAKLKKEHSQTDEAALKYFCLVALNLNEFIYLE